MRHFRLLKLAGGVGAIVAPATNTMLWGAANNMQWGAANDMMWG